MRKLFRELTIDNLTFQPAPVKLESRWYVVLQYIYKHVTVEIG